MKPMLAKSLLTMVMPPLATVALGSVALAQDAPEAGSDPAHVGTMRHCSTLSDDAARLACFDAASAALIAEFDNGKIRLVRTEEIEKTRKTVFGFATPTITLFGGKDSEGEKVEQMDTLASTITRVSTFGDDSYRITIAEGDAVWEMRDTPTRFRAPKVGDSVEFQRAALSSYWVRVNGQMGVKGKRIQ